MNEENHYEDQVSESKAWRAALPENLHTLTPRTNEAFERFKFIEPPHDLDAKFADFARQLELELNSANGRIAELTRKTPPHECPQESVALLCANHPSLAEYVAQMEKQIADLTSERDDNQRHYHNAMDELREKRRHLDEQRALHNAAMEELSAAKEVLWPDQAGLPNEHRNAALAIKAIKELVMKNAVDSAKALGMALDLNLDLQNKADMWRDEFERIKACAYIDDVGRNSEIKGICDRAMLDIRSKISLIDQREKVADENIDLRRELRVISDHYDILRTELVETNAKAMHGLFQAAANGKSMEYCRTITNAKLRGKCIICDGKGTTIGGEQGAQYEECCFRCEGAGYIEIPDLSWLKNGKIQFHLLPKEHPDYDPTLE